MFGRSHAALRRTLTSDPGSKYTSLTALATGTIVVADSDAFGGVGGLIAVDPSTGGQTAISQGGMFVDPGDVTFAHDRSVVATDLTAFGGSGGVIGVDPASGRQTKLVASTVFARPLGIATEADGRVVLAYLARVEPGLGDVFRVDLSNGEHRLASPGATFFAPGFVALGAGSDVFVTEADIAGDNSRLQLLPGAGSRILCQGQPPGAIYGGVAVERSGTILVVNTPNHDHQQVLRFAATGGTPAVVTQDNKLRSPMGVAVEANGHILVCDRSTGVVRVDPATGAQSVVSTGGVFTVPLGLAIAP